MGASLSELVRGLTGAVTREDAKKLAHLHGHPWKAVLKAMKRRANTSRRTMKAINRAARMASEFGGIPDLAIVDGVEVRRGR